MYLQNFYNITNNTVLTSIIMVTRQVLVFLIKEIKGIGVFVRFLNQGYNFFLLIKIIKDFKNYERNSFMLDKREL